MAINGGSASINGSRPVLFEEREPAVLVALDWSRALSAAGIAKQARREDDTLMARAAISGE
eukprot:753193-Rhodomonas_salina.2